MKVSPMRPDYVTRGEFKELKDDIVADVAEQNKDDMTAWREIIQGDFKSATEQIIGRVETMEKNILETVSMNIYKQEKNLLETVGMNMHKLEKRIEKKLDTKLSQSYFVEYMEKFEKKILTAK